MRHRSSWLGVISILLAITACELKPAPRQQRQQPAAQPSPGAPAAAPRPATPPGATAVAPAGPGADVRAQSCLEVGVRITEIMISSAIDAVAKAQYEQERANIVRALANACTTNQWDDAVRQCFLTARTQPEVDACKTRVPAPRAPAPAPGAPAAPGAPPAPGAPAAPTAPTRG